MNGVSFPPANIVALEIRHKTDFYFDFNLLYMVTLLDI